MHAELAMTAGRHGNPARRELLLDSRDQPWSAPERQCHRLLWAAGITGRQANQLIRLDGLEGFPDIVFRAQRLVTEIDGRLFHADPKSSSQTGNGRTCSSCTAGGC